jgi:superfamily I DNA/RNA helicase
VLRTNYRNTAEILEVAERVVAADTYDDLEGTPLDGHRDIEVRRRGGVAITVHAREPHSLEAALTTQIEDTRARLKVGYGDMAVLVRTRKELLHYAGVLRRAGIPSIDLMDYDGISVDQVKVGTFKRAKGLEFKFVLLPGIPEGPLEPWRGESEDSYRERAERMRRELYVGMTRARDGLWLGYLPTS